MNLETILENIEQNYCYKSNSEIEVFKQSARIQHAAYTEFKNGAGISPTARKYGINKATVHGWKINKPRILGQNQVSYLPHTDEEKLDFAYVLGAFSRKYSPGLNKFSAFVRQIHPELPRERFRQALSNCIKEEVTVRKGNSVGTSNRRFYSLLEYILTNKSSEYISNDTLRTEFVKGYVNTSATTVTKYVSEKKVNIGYVFTNTNPLTLKLLASCFLELDIYPKLLKDKLYIRGDSLRNFHEQQLDSNPDNVNWLNTYFEGRARKKYTIDTYYAIRRRARNNPTICPIKLKKEFGIENTRTVKGWIRDYISNIEGPLRLQEARKYERLLDFLSLPNVHMSRSLVYRNNKAFYPIDGEINLIFDDLENAQPKMFRKYGFIPINGKVYTINPTVMREHSLNIWEIDEVQKELTKQLEGGKESITLSNKTSITSLERNIIHNTTFSLHMYGKKHIIYDNLLNAKTKIYNGWGFIPRGNDVYFIKRGKMSSYGIDHSDLEYLAKEVERKCNGLKSTLKISNKNEIERWSKSYPYLTHLKVNINNTTYTVFNKALGNYFKTFDASMQPLTLEDKIAITHAIEDELSSKYMDYRVEIDGTYVLNISRNLAPKNALMSTMRDSEGIGDDGIMGLSGEGY